MLFMTFAFAVSSLLIESQACFASKGQNASFVHFPKYAHGGGMSTNLGLEHVANDI